MAREDSVRDTFPKKRLAAALTGLTITALGVIAEKLFRSMLETAISAIAGISLILLVFTFFAFFGAWEKREDLYEKRMNEMKLQMEEINNKVILNSQSSSFSHQSLLVGLSANHVNELQEQRQYYEDYIAAVLYVLDTALIRVARAETSIIPIVEGLMRSPEDVFEIIVRDREKNNKELRKWKTFLNSIRDDLSKQDLT